MSTDLIALALAEDIGTGDVTVRFFTDPDRISRAVLLVRESACLAGLDVAAEVFRRVDPDLVCRPLAADGAQLSPGQHVLEIEGRTGSLLTAERTALNFIQRLSGVATLTKRYVSAVEGTGAKILDTRKTTPGFRMLEKAAVRAGGGTNHRMGLFDMAMVKDNHLAADPGVLQERIDRLKQECPGLRVELEADTLEQALGFFRLRGVDVVLLDNMHPEQMRQAVAARPHGILLEASGGITLEAIRTVAETGVDFISVGALTHSARAIDFSLEIP